MNRHSQLRELSRLFFGRFLENDLICVDGDTRGTLIGVVSLLIAPGVFLPFLEYLQFGSHPLYAQPWYVRDLVAVPHKLLHIALSMTVLGLVTVFEWDALLPDRRDVAVLRPFPIGVGTLFAAKVFALFQFWVLFTLAVDGISSVLFPLAILQRAPFDLLLWYAGSHATALIVANAFIFLAMIAIQGVLITVLGFRRFRRVAPYAQFILLVLILSLFFFSIGRAFGLNLDAPPSPLIQSLPAYWFLGLDQTLLGWHKPLFDHLAPLAWWGLGTAAALAALVYALSYQRAIGRLFEEHDGPSAAPSRLALACAEIANGTLLRDPAGRAAFFFVCQTLARSRSHRLLAAAWAGAGFALVFEGIMGAMAIGTERWWQSAAGPLLAVPIVLPLFLVTGLRQAFNVPAELRANWLFQSAAATPARVIAGARKAALVLGLAPLFSILCPLFIALWGWTAGGLHVLFGAVVAWLLLEVQLARLEKLPFTCSYVAGKANLKNTWTFYVIGYLAYVATLSWIDLKILEQPLRFLGFLAAAAIAKLAIDLYRNRHTGYPLLFDERPDPAVRTLELHS